MRRAQIDQLRIEIHPDRAAAGAAAAAEVADTIRAAQRETGGVRVLFASAPSQDEMLAALTEAPDIDWPMVTAFQLDEYLGIALDDARGFGHYLDHHLAKFVPLGRVHYIDGLADPGAECRRYAATLARAPIDVCCLGIGENGHLAFNDPPAARFDDPEPMRVVELSVASRRQQVHDGLWPALPVVPRRALTLTIPTLLAAQRIVCTVPGRAKRAALRRALHGPIDAACPASVLRTHPDAVLITDADAWPGDQA